MPLVSLFPWVHRKETLILGEDRTGKMKSQAIGGFRTYRSWCWQCGSGGQPKPPSKRLQGQEWVFSPNCCSFFTPILLCQLLYSHWEIQINSTKATHYTGPAPPTVWYLDSEFYTYFFICIIILKNKATSLAQSVLTFPSCHFCHPLAKQRWWFWRGILS